MAPQSKRFDSAFLPAIQEVETTPPSPVGRWILWTVVLLIVLSVVWAISSKVDIVSVSRGQLVPSGDARMVQPAVAGTLMEVLVKEGDVVTAGQLVARLDTQTLDQQISALKSESERREIELARLEVALQGIDTPNMTPTAMNTAFEHAIAGVVNASNRHITESERQLLQQSVRQHQAQLMEYRSATRKAEEERASAQAQMQSAKEILPVLQSQHRSLSILSKKQLGSLDDLREIQKQLIDAKYTLQQATSTVEVATLQIEELAAKKEIYLEQLKSNHVIKRNENIHRLAELSDRIAQLSTERSKHNLYAPDEGVVQELAYQSKGPFLKEGDTLMKLVPQNEPLYAEVWVLNKDIGFLDVGQAVALKLDTFNFTRYGKVEGELLKLSVDAVEHEQMGLVYKATIALQSNAIKVDGREKPLEPGMSLSAEIRTGERTILEFFTSVFAKHLDQAITVK